jgi:hypothetical protein
VQSSLHAIECFVVVADEEYAALPMIDRNERVVTSKSHHGSGPTSQSSGRAQAQHVSRAKAGVILDEADPRWDTFGIDVLSTRIVIASELSSEHRKRIGIAFFRDVYFDRITAQKRPTALRAHAVAIEPCDAASAKPNRELLGIERRVDLSNAHGRLLYSRLIAK